VNQAQRDCIVQLTAVCEAIAQLSIAERLEIYDAVFCDPEEDPNWDDPFEDQLVHETMKAAIRLSACGPGVPEDIQVVTEMLAQGVTRVSDLKGPIGDAWRARRSS
jgi:hypothetical protein